MPPNHERDRQLAAGALLAVAPLATRWIERLLAQRDPALTITQLLALRAIANEGASRSELAQRAGVSGPAVSQMLTTLSSAGLLQRTVKPDDRRGLELALSERGREVYEETERALSGELSSLLAELPGPEATALAHALPGVEASLSGAAPPRRPHHPPPPPPR